MKIYQTAQKIPGGVMVVPLMLGALVNTFIPEALMIGSFTTALFKAGAVTFIAFACFCCGVAIDIKQAATPVAKGAALVAVKMAIGVGIGWTVGQAFGPAGIWGLAPLAIIPALSNASGGLYIALANEYGDSTDVAAQSMLILSEGPFFTMLIFGATGMADIPLLALLASILPVVIGFILGNLDPDIRQRFSNPQMVIPFMAFCLGANLDLRTIVDAGVPGIMLGVLCVFATGLGGYYSTRLFGNSFRAVGAAIGSTAGNAMTTPMILAAADPSFLASVDGATAQIATSVIVSCALCPVLVSYLHKREKLAK